MATLQFTDVLETEICCSCGIRFAMPSDYQRRRREDHGSFFCPAGHSQHYTGKTDADRLKEEREAKERAQQEVARAEEAAAKAQRSLSRLKKRVAAGVCPCCTRTFTNLARHMAHKHPEVAGP